MVKNIFSAICKSHFSILGQICYVGHAEYALCSLGAEYGGEFIKSTMMVI